MSYLEVFGVLTGVPRKGVSNTFGMQLQGT